MVPSVTKDYTSSNDRMKANDFKRMWKKAIMAKFTVISYYLPGWAQEDHEIP
jgi:hypothetical protein